MSLPRRVLAEALASAFLLATIIGSGIMAQRLAGGNGALALLCNTIPTGAILVVLINVFGSVSGAHLNPIVSLVLALRRSLPWSELGPYIVAQFIGAMLGVLMAHAMFELPIFQLSTVARTGTGQWIAEAVAAFGLILVLLGSSRETVAVSVGLYITAAYWFTASTSFANPAVTLARALSDSFAGIALNSVPEFIAAQIVGCLVALLIAPWMFNIVRRA